MGIRLGSRFGGGDAVVGLEKQKDARGNDACDFCDAELMAGAGFAQTKRPACEGGSQKY